MEFNAYLDQQIEKFYAAIKELDADKSGRYDNQYVIIDKALSRILDLEDSQFIMVNAADTVEPLLFKEPQAKRVTNKINSERQFHFKVKRIQLKIYFVNMIAFLTEMKETASKTREDEQWKCKKPLI